MGQRNNFVVQYVHLYARDFEDLQQRILDRIDNYGAYKFLRNKSSEEIKGYGIKEFKLLFNSLYSTQRQKVYNDLEELLVSDSGLKYFQGFINRILKSNSLDIDQLYMDQREQIKHYSTLIGNGRLGFGKNTMSQIAHFCKPDQYPLSNTKSQVVILHLYGRDISDNYYDFHKYADLIVGNLRSAIEKSVNFEMELIFRNYKYVILDDFVEFVYDIIKQSPVKGGK